MSQGNPGSAVVNGQEAKSPGEPPKRGLRFKRLFTRAGVNPFDEIEWESRTASIQNEKGETIFEQPNVEVPKDWSMTATNIVASKYFHGNLGTAERESSVGQLVSRVAETVALVGLRTAGISSLGKTAKTFAMNSLTFWFTRKQLSIYPSGSIAA